MNPNGGSSGDMGPESAEGSRMSKAIDNIKHKAILDLTQGVTEQSTNEGIIIFMTGCENHAPIGPIRWTVFEVERYIFGDPSESCSTRKCDIGKIGGQRLNKWGQPEGYLFTGATKPRVSSGLGMAWPSVSTTPRHLSTVHGEGLKEHVSFNSMSMNGVTDRRSYGDDCIDDGVRVGCSTLALPTYVMQVFIYQFSNDANPVFAGWTAGMVRQLPTTTLGAGGRYHQNCGVVSVSEDTGQWCAA
ncbi:uncharacterized protein MELLADRAFT_112436 [Melampsora larici-populina 98AG31]|uniref:Uncharacterized protein n=1 Tax=Melampsora larici-populina (strain 98AG31 / pathotype 3-4-7) TaxID=747676 RepID=F4S6G9_MELLP|nr:uncharacterized protein MELLADRAFT_112436 [Melampsora larici-populina 98AG31]EGF99763.1 hypothetical protein MELLADRAFT_112436 [Melampsora larici-populina 98AG31]